MKDLKETTITEAVNCDICGELAQYDAKTKQGQWGYLCEKHFKLHGIGLGTGKGQRLILVTDNAQTKPEYRIFDGAGNDITESVELERGYEGFVVWQDNKNISGKVTIREV